MALTPSNAFMHLYVSDAEVGEPGNVLTAGLRELRLHCLRHSYGTMAAEAYPDLSRVKFYMGHSSLTVTERYLQKKARKEDADLMEAHIQSSLGAGLFDQGNAVPPQGFGGILGGDLLISSMSPNSKIPDVQGFSSWAG